MGRSDSSSSESHRRLRLVFFGSGAFGLPTLKRLSRDHRVLAVVTQPDRPAGRKRRPTPTPVGQWTAENLPGIDLLKPENVNDPAVLNRIRDYDCGSTADRSGAWVVIAFGQKLSQPLLADRFAINLHASLLPRWRGAAPINHAMLAGDRQTGNSVITLADRMDAGLILGQSTRELEAHLTAGELHDLLASDGPELIGSVLDRYATGTLSPKQQDPQDVTIAPKLHKALGFLDLARSDAPNAVRHIHGLNPWPGVTVRFRGEPLKLHRARVLAEKQPGEPGRFIDPAAGTLRCAGGTVMQVLTVQPAGRPPMTYEAFFNGTKPAQEELIERFDESADPC